MNKLAGVLSGVKVESPQIHHNLAIYPLHIPNGHQRGYKTLDEAMTAQEFIVKEVSEGGSVPSLAVHNTGTLPVLIVVGEELIGAKQNRVLNTSILVPAASELKIPVSCVERGRWSYTSPRFAASPNVSHASLRMKQVQNVTSSLRADAHFDANQSDVWQEVERKISSHHTSSHTRAMHDVFQQSETQLKDYLDAFTVPDAEGIVVAINGQVVGADLFDHAETMRTIFPKLARSYALDAIEQQSAASDQAAKIEVEPFLTAAQHVQDEVYDSVGLGQDVRLTDKQIAGSGLLWQDHFVHTSLFKVK
jgi:hypothetical protein